MMMMESTEGYFVNINRCPLLKGKYKKIKKINEDALCFVWLFHLFIAVVSLFCFILVEMKKKAISID